MTNLINITVASCVRCHRDPAYMFGLCVKCLASDVREFGRTACYVHACSVCRTAPVFSEYNAVRSYHKEITYYCDDCAKKTGNYNTYWTREDAIDLWRKNCLDLAYMHQITRECCEPVNIPFWRKDYKYAMPSVEPWKRRGE